MLQSETGARNRAYSPKVAPTSWPRAHPYSPESSQFHVVMAVQRQFGANEVHFEFSSFASPFAIR